MKTNDAALKKLEIIHNLGEVPDEHLDEVNSFVKFILFKYKDKKAQKKREPKTLAGIWKGKGFEQIADLDKEIANIRKELADQILEKRI